MASVGVRTRPTGVLKKPPSFAVEGGHGARAVDPHQPVGLERASAAASSGLSCSSSRRLAKASRIACCVIDCSHRRWIGFFHAGELDDVAEDQFAFAPGVAGVDDGVDILALGQPYPAA